MIDGYVLQSSDGDIYLVLKSDDSYWIGRVLRKLQTMREKDLKRFFRKLEATLDDYNE